MSIRILVKDKMPGKSIEHKMKSEPITSKHAIECWDLVTVSELCWGNVIQMFLSADSVSLCFFYSMFARKKNMEMWSDFSFHPPSTEQSIFKRASFPFFCVCFFFSIFFLVPPAPLRWFPVIGKNIVIQCSQSGWKSSNWSIKDQLKRFSPSTAQSNLVDDSKTYENPVKHGEARC